VLFLFFFSSRRRHTRSYGDWSSDVCSSDLPAQFGTQGQRAKRAKGLKDSRNEAYDNDDGARRSRRAARLRPLIVPTRLDSTALRSEEHTSELQSPYDLVCRLLLEKKNKLER